MNKKLKIILVCSLVTVFILVAAVVIVISTNKHEHSFSDEYTCHDRVCSSCGEEIKATTAHDIEEYTCKDRVCSSCGEVIKATTAHDIEEYTCKDRVCSSCGEVIKATTAHTVETPNSCNDQTCLNCGDTVYGAHSFADGYTCHDRQCTKCLEIIAATTAHTYGNNSTCIQRVCSDCGHIEKASTSHNFIDGVCGCGASIKGMTFATVEGGCAVTGYSGNNKSLIIPDTYEGQKVVSIKAAAFKNSDIFAIEIGSNVAEIGYETFINCKKLESIRFCSSENLKTIGENAFKNCRSLIAIQIPEGVVTLSDGAFYGCVSLKNAGIPATLSGIGANAFYNCVSLERLDFDGAISEVGIGAFYNCTSLKKVDFGERATVKHIKNATAQLYFWKDGKYYYRGFPIDNGSSAGDEITMIVNLLIDNTTDNAVYLINESKSMVSFYPFTQTGGETEDVSFSGEISKFRLNLARNVGQRSAIIDYVGYFSTFDEAKAYVHSSDNFVNCAQYLSENKLSLLWGDGSSQAKAEKKAVAAISDLFGISCTVLKSTYIVPTTTEKGQLVFDAVFKNDGKTEIVKNIVAIIDEEPSDYHIWRFNDEEFLSKITPANVKLSIENNMLHMVTTDALSEDGFYFVVDCPDDYPQFYLQNYAFMRLRYRRIGVGGGQMYYFNEDYDGSHRQELYLGKKSGDWYTTIICINVKSYDVPIAINYNETTGEVEEVKQLASYGLNKFEFSGKVKSFRMNLARVRYLYREADIEYIAFFPTWEAAFNFDASTETAKSNGQKAISGYSGESLLYYDGETKAAALDSAKNIILKKLGSGYTVTIDNAEYTAPVKDVLDGQLKVSAKVYKEEKFLFDTAN